MMSRFMTFKIKILVCSFTFPPQVGNSQRRACFTQLIGKSQIQFLVASTEISRSPCGNRKIIDPKPQRGLKSRTSTLVHSPPDIGTDNISLHSKFLCFCIRYTRYAYSCRNPCSYNNLLTKKSLHIYLFYFMFLKKSSALPSPVYLNRNK